MSHGRLFETGEAEQDGLHVELVVAPAITHALVANGAPVVRKLTLTNRSPRSAFDLAVSLQIVGSAGPLTSSWLASPGAPIPPGRSVSWEEFAGFAPDLAAGPEAQPVVYRVRVARPEGEALSLEVASRLLAPDEWLDHPALYDTLPAHVAPDTAAVEAVLVSASSILLRHTGSEVIQGYQAGPARAAQIAAAVYAALRGAGVASTEAEGRAEAQSPAQAAISGDAAGSDDAASSADAASPAEAVGSPDVASVADPAPWRIASVAAVLKHRGGNSLDLAVTYAACLARAGLHPLIWLTQGRAVGGYFLESERLGSITVTEANLLTSLADAGRAVPVSLTDLAEADFGSAVRAGLAALRDPGAALLAAVDVALAHRTGMAPLPAADEPVPALASAGVGAGELELPAGPARNRLAERAAETAEVVDERDTAPPRVRQWKRALLDLSLRNPLLNLPTRGKGIDLLLPSDALKDLDDLVHEGKRVTLVAQDAVSQVQALDPAVLARELREDHRVYAAVTSERYRTVCSGLQRAARTMQQETGSNYLYLTLGTLVHPKDNGTEARAPLFLLPVRVEGGLGRSPYHIVIDGTETASANHCLVEWLRVKHRARIPELERPILDEAGIDIPATLQALRDGLLAHQLNYRIDETASLRLLQFGTFPMWRDLTDHWESFMDNPVVRHLVHRVDADFVDPADDGSGEPAVDESTLFLPIEADGSQMQAVLLAEQGRSFVLEGPPGTGKSQTITNMITQAIHSGRTVLFVAEKQAALEVVKRRLDKVGLGPFVLDLHGRTQSLNAIRAQLREALDQADPGDDGAWEAATAKFRAELGPLARYPERVHGRNAAGISLWQAFADTLRYGGGPAASVPLEYLWVPPEQREAVARALTDLPPIAHAARPQRAWSLAELRGVGALDPAAVLAVANQLEHARQALAERTGLAAVVASLNGPGVVSRVVPAAALARDGLLPDRSVTEWAQRATWDADVSYLQASLAELWHDHAADLAMFRDDILLSPELDGWLADAREAADKFLPWSRSKGLHRVEAELATYRRDQSIVDEDQLPAILGRLVAARLAAADIEYQLGRIGGLRLPPGWRPTGDGAPEQLAAAIQATRIGRALLREASLAWEYLTGSPGVDDHDILLAVDTAWREWGALLQVTGESLALWAGDGWYAAWQRDGAQWQRQVRDEGLGGLHRWAALLAVTDPLLHNGLSELRGLLLRGELEPDEAEQAYRRGLGQRALAERVQAGDLAFFEAGVHDGRIENYDGAAARLREAVVAHAPAQLVRRRGQRPAELDEQLKRKRGGLSFRELFARHAPVIQAVTPCVLVSPASAALFLPPDAAKFDIVIFDEASQIRVAEAVGAMGRGRSAVIVGDSRQMPPTAIMQASHDEDEPDEAQDEEVPEDLDSILSEAVESRVPQRWLSWHYRSRDESLIAFSNRRYYDSKLFSLPSPTAGTAAGTAVVWRRVAGEFDRGRGRTNQVEAQAVVDEIRRRLADPATARESIGVVTFNIQQRDLILDLLEGSDDELVHAALEETLEEPLFVKNLENVQGDERDTILFSLAFSTDPVTGRLPLNFGPLSMTGGERRLNVAITRAKRTVQLFASFDPADIDLARTTAQGTRDLRAYCEMAANGPGVLGDLASTRQRRDDAVRAEVAAALRDRGHDVVVGHGLSDFTVDIAVRRPGAPSWQVAIILDGPDWARRSTVADRDAAPLHLPRHMSWPVLLRFWLPAWLRDREAFLRDVDAAVARAEEQAQEQARVRAPEPAPSPAPAPVEAAAAAPKPAKRPRKKAAPRPASEG